MFWEEEWGGMIIQCQGRVYHPITQLQPSSSPSPPLPPHLRTDTLIVSIISHCQEYFIVSWWRIGSCRHNIELTFLWDFSESFKSFFRKTDLIGWLWIHFGESFQLATTNADRTRPAPPTRGSHVFTTNDQNEEMLFICGFDELSGSIGFVFGSHCVCRLLCDTKCFSSTSNNFIEIDEIRSDGKCLF